MTGRRDFALLWTSQAASQFGTATSTLAYPLLVLDLTGSAAQAGLVGTVVAAVGLAVRLPGGILADRHPPRALMLASDGLRAAVLATLAALVLAGLAPVPVVLAAVAVEVAAGAVFGPAEFSLVRAVAPVAERALAVGRMQSRAHLAGLLGPAVGGAAYAIAPALPFAIDAVSYLASLLLVLGVRRRVTPRAAGGAVGLGAGWRWLAARPYLLASAGWVALLTAVFGAVGLLVIVLARDRGAQDAEIGLMSAISAAGGLAGALATPALQRRLSPRAVFRMAAAVDLAATLCLVPVREPLLIGLIGAAAFFLAPAVAASFFGELSARAPDHLVGRVQSTAALVVGLVAPLTPVGIGAVLDTAGVPTGLGVCAVGFGLLTVAALALPRYPPLTPPESSG